MNATYRIMPQLPWDIIPEEANRFRNLVLGILGLFLLLSFLVSIIDLPEQPRERPVVPERLVKLVIEQKEKPVPPPVKQPEPEKPKEEEKKPEPKPEEKKPEVKEPPKEVKVDKKEKAKEEAQKHIAVFDALADLRTAVEPAAKPGQPLKVDEKAGAGPKPSERALIADKAKAGSGGIVTAKASSAGGTGSGISAPTTSEVTSAIGGLDPNQLRASRDPNDPNAKGNVGRRPDENIQQGFDNAKGSIFALYHRALRSNPGLRGKVIFRLEIQPDGSVTKAEVVSSELNDPDLERKLLAKVRQIQFGQMNVSTWNDSYRMDFFPS
ncbi:AgmX/PglI C-terminal domain-containing protein [Permianibacter aggregans]|uniref:Outer membrane transport energization protein TonB n=1 Tax=Permianibacter aggregans TaxID=1510150 RepID=A0A4R6UIE0_9GAMM|nr:AgmX/PglI C-terminal domain-containing protein [Permianibacter aggregans]QGX41222.1 AgmX/PglI C-terminal domain-containing protein [Permianibacter aggregans]TDQ45826.1 outer membrane transport energization protein TonB [Permianibacter aggregans]